MLLVFSGKTAVGSGWLRSKRTNLDHWLPLALPKIPLFDKESSSDELKTWKKWKFSDQMNEIKNPCKLKSKRWQGKTLKARHLQTAAIGMVERVPIFYFFSLRWKSHQMRFWKVNLKQFDALAFYGVQVQQKVKCRMETNQQMQYEWVARKLA